MKFDWLWQAHFADGKVIKQPEDDRYSKHDDLADWNPSSFRDFLEYFNDGEHKLSSFGLVNEKTQQVVVVRLDMDKPKMFSYKNGDVGVTPIHKEMQLLKHVQPIYYRAMRNTVIDGKFGEPEVEAYCIGYQGKNKDGQNVKYIHKIAVI